MHLARDWQQMGTDNGFAMHTFNYGRCLQAWVESQACAHTAPHCIDGTPAQRANSLYLMHYAQDLAKVATSCFHTMRMSALNCSSFLHQSGAYILNRQTDLCTASCWSMGVTRVSPMHDGSERLLKALSSCFSGLCCTRGVLKTSLEAAGLLSVSGFCIGHRAGACRSRTSIRVLTRCGAARRFSFAPFSEGRGDIHISRRTYLMLDRRGCSECLLVQRCILFPVLYASTNCDDPGL